MIKNLSPILIVLGVGIWSVWPVVKCPDCVADYGRDGILINWIVNTAGKNLYGFGSGMRGGIFGGNIFYPYKNVLAYSEMFFLTASWTFPVALWVQNTAVVSGMALVGGQVLTMLIIYEWWKKLTKNKWSAAVATVAFGLSQIRFEYQVHLQMWSMQYWLIGTWLVCSWLVDKKIWKLYAGALLLGAQAWESLLPIYFAAMIIGAKLIIDHCSLFNKKILFALLIFGVAAAVPLAAYWGVSREFNYQRSIRDAANNSLGVDEIWGKFASPGLYVLLAVAGFRLVRSRKLNLRQLREVKWLGLVLGASLIIAFGPTLKWGGKTVKAGGVIPVPLPYAAAYYLVPGFGALRTPSRWIWVSGWAASGLIALGINNLQFNIFNRRKFVAIGGLILVAVAGGTKIGQVRKIPGPGKAPGVYRWLSAQPGKIIVIMPMYPSEEEIDRLPFLYVHQKFTLNGFSGFYPLKRMDEAMRWTANFPARETTSEMKEYGVEYVVVEKKKFAAAGWQLVVKDKIIWEDRDYLVVQI